MKSDLIDANQLKGILTLTGSTAEEYAEALQKTMQIALEQPLVAYSEPLQETDCLGFVYTSKPSELLVKESDYPLDDTTVVSGTLSLSDICNPTLVALQCRSCGGIIDKDNMTCKHCGMTYMLVNSSEVSPRYSDF